MSVLPKCWPLGLGRYVGLVQSACIAVMKQQLRCYVIPNPSYIHQEEVADRVVRHVREKQQNRESVLIINNPGSPAIVNKFIKEGVKHVVCTGVAKDDIKSLKSALGGGVLCTHYNFMSLHKGQLEKHILSQLPVSIQEQGLTVLTTLRERKNPQLNESVFSVMTNKCMAYPGLLDTPRTEFFIFLTERRFQQLQKSEWLYSHKVYRAFFNISHIMQLESSDFTPPLIEENKNKKSADESGVQLVHFTPNQAILAELSLDDRKKFKKFIRFCLKKDTIITFLERVLPGCGLPMIKLGFTMNDENMTLSSQQYFILFKNIQQWPGYEDSPIRLHLEGQHNKFKDRWMEEQSEETP